MVEDNQIEATESPFAMRKGEIKVFDGKDGYVSMNQIINKINMIKMINAEIKAETAILSFLFFTLNTFLLL